MVFQKSYFSKEPKCIVLCLSLGLSINIKILLNDFRSLLIHFANNYYVITTIVIF